MGVLTGKVGTLKKLLNDVWFALYRENKIYTAFPHGWAKPFWWEYFKIVFCYNLDQ